MNSSTFPLTAVSEIRQGYKHVLLMGRIDKPRVALAAMRGFFYFEAKLLTIGYQHYCMLKKVI